MREGKPIETVGVGAGGREGDPSQAGEDGNEAGKMSSAGQGLRWQWAEGWVSVLPQLPLPGPPLFPDPCQGQGVCVCQEALCHCFPTHLPCPALPCHTRPVGGQRAAQTLPTLLTWARPGQKWDADLLLPPRMQPPTPRRRRVLTPLGVSHSTWHLWLWAGGRAQEHGCLPHL